jgi:hypothetical protein
MLNIWKLLILHIVQNEQTIYPHFRDEWVKVAKYKNWLKREEADKTKSTASFSKVLSLPQ